MTKVGLTGMNKAMCDMVRKKFGIEYNTGAVPTKEKTEKLKADSLKEEVKELSHTVKELEAEREKLVTPLENIPGKTASNGRNQESHRTRKRTAPAEGRWKKTLFLQKRAYTEGTRKV